ncbi:hypothetical protein Tco_0226631 [Tanacetum coccineum]
MIDLWWIVVSIVGILVDSSSYDVRCECRVKVVDKHHFIKEQVKNRVVELYFVRTEYQLKDIFTNPLARERLDFLINKLGMRIIMEYLVNINKRRAFWSLNEDILKITILKTNTSYPSRKIWRIRACTHQRPQRKKDQYAVSRRPIRRIGIIVCEYSGRCQTWSLLQETPIRCIQSIGYAVNLDNSTNNVLIPLDSWTSGLLEYKLPLRSKMDDPNITMEEYIRLEEEKAQKRGKVFNWETAKYGKIWYDEDVHDLRSVEAEFPSIAFNNEVSSEETLSSEPTVSSLNDEIDFRVSFDDSDAEDYTPTVSCFDDLDFFNDFENEFPAIVYNDALTSKSNLSTKPTLCPQHIDDFDLKDET